MIQIISIYITPLSDPSCPMDGVTVILKDNSDQDIIVSS